MRVHKDRPMTHTVVRHIEHKRLKGTAKSARWQCRLTPSYIILKSGDVYYRDTGRARLSQEFRIFSDYNTHLDLSTLSAGV